MFDKSNQEPNDKVILYDDDEELEFGRKPTATPRSMLNKKRKPKKLLRKMTT